MHIIKKNVTYLNIDSLVILLMQKLIIYEKFSLFFLCNASKITLQLKGPIKILKRMLSVYNN